MDKSQEKQELKLLCDVRELEDNWNKTPSQKNNNVRKRYIGIEEKSKQLKIIDMGIFCIINDITPDMLNMGVRHIKEVASLFTNQKVKDNNKIVIMSEEDYKEYEQFKNFRDISKKMSKK